MENDTFVFTGVIIQEEVGYTSLCLDLDVASEGDTIADAKAELAEAVTLYLETALESQLPWLRPVPPSEDPRFTAPRTVVETFLLRVSVSIRVHA